MAQLKDLLVTGASRLIDDVFTNKIQVTKIDAPTASNGTIYGPGSSGQVLMSNGTSAYWGGLTTGVSGVKGNAESSYRTGNINLTPANLGAAPIASPALTGTPTAPTAASGTNNTQIATTAFVYNAFTANDAMVFKGVVNSNSDLPATHYQGWTYKVGKAGTYAGKTCEVGDTIYCVTDGTAANNDHWVVVQANVDAPLYKDGNTFAGNKILLSDGTGGKVKEGITVGAADLPVYLNNGVPTTITSYKGNAATATKATQDGSGNTITSTYLKLSGGTMTGALNLNGVDINLRTSGTSSDDTGDITWWYGNGKEKARLWQDNTYTVKTGPTYRVYSSDGTNLYNGRLPLADGTSATGTWGISITGNAATATKLGTATVGSANQPVYLNAGTPTPITWKSLGGSHPTHLYSAASTFTTTTVPTSDWWVCITLNRTWDPNLTDLVIMANYSNHGGVLYLDCDAHTTLWRAYLTDYAGTNILAIKRVQNSSSKKTEIYLKLAKPTEFQGSIPQGTITVYSPVAIDSITQLTADPGGLINLRSGYNSNTAITTSGTIYGNLSGNASTANYLISNSRMDYGWNGVNYFNFSAANQSAAKVNDTPFSSATWTHILRFNHANNAGYYTDLAVPFNENGIYYKRISGGTLLNSSNNGGWVKVFDNSMTIPIGNGGTGATTAANARTNLGLGTMATETAANYLKLSGGTMTGALNTANNTWNSIGDDVQIGDINRSGSLGIQGKNGNTGLFFTTYNQTNKLSGGAIDWDGSKFTITGTVATSISGNAATATKIATYNTVTNDNNNTQGYFLVYTWNLSTWSNHRMSFLVTSRHTGSGLIDIAVGCNADTLNISNVYAQIKYWGNTGCGSVIASDSWQIYISSDCTKAYLFARYTDYNTAVITPLTDTRPTKSTWMTTIDAATYGTRKATTEINVADKLATGRTVQTNLASTSSASFDGSANITPGITGTLGVANGGTGATTFTSGALLIGNGTSAVGTRTIKNMTALGDLGWTSSATDIYIPTVNTLAYWNGRYNSSSSNLTYCVKGAFGNAVTYGVDDATANGALGTGTGLTTERSVYYGLVTVNGASQTRATGIYAPTSAGTSGYVLQSSGSGAPTWINATNNNTASTIVKRDGSGNFSAGTITATLSGTATNATNVNILVPTTSTNKCYILGGAENSTAAGNQRINKAYYASGAQNTTGIYFIPANGVLVGAAWNDYAEYRKPKDNIQIEAGRVVKENGDGTLSLATKRLERGCEIVSDTYGFVIGENDATGTTLPTAATGRVLAYPDADPSTFEIGAPVCSGENGTVSMMTEEEEIRYPSRIIGTVSEIPTYEVWHGGQDVEVRGRIWIRIR